MSVVIGGTCEACKWWAEFVRVPPEQESIDEPKYEAEWPGRESWTLDGYHIDRIAERGGRMGRCILTVKGSAGKAAAMDGSDYFAVLETSPDFSCNQWEAKA